ncbi:hypothetical protein IW262DRAFT_1454564 [Armillaria fumosa]|nr:hypothetical protein IW262DRAFT_1454564 [Armillaria fumosa]
MPSDNVDPCDLEGDARLHWWHSWAPWFASRGYQLHELVYETEGEYTELTLSLLPAMKFRGEDMDPSPYAYIEGDVHPQGALVEPEKLKPTFPNSVASDAEGRLVAIKIVKKDTHHAFPSPGRAGKTHKNCVLPILDTLDVESEILAQLTYCQVGHCPTIRFQDSGIVLAYMHCMLKGLRFLHSKNIVHRDIKYPNTAMNYCCGFYGRYPDSLKYTTLQAQGLIKYTTIDFDFAFMFRHRAIFLLNVVCLIKIPGQGQIIVTYTTPNKVNMTTIHSHSTSLSLDISFHLTPYEPMLAPMPDKMVTRTVSNHFTASEALAFLEDFLPSVHLDTPVPSDSLTGDYEQYDKWKDLPAEFI